MKIKPFDFQTATRCIFSTLSYTLKINKLKRFFFFDLDSVRSGECIDLTMMCFYFCLCTLFRVE